MVSPLAIVNDPPNYSDLRTWVWKAVLSWLVIDGSLGPAIISQETSGILHLTEPAINLTTAALHQLSWLHRTTISFRYRSGAKPRSGAARICVNTFGLEPRLSALSKEPRHLVPQKNPDNPQNSGQSRRRGNWETKPGEDQSGHDSDGKGFDIL